MKYLFTGPIYPGVSLFPAVLPLGISFEVLLYSLCSQHRIFLPEGKKNLSVDVQRLQQIVPLVREIVFLFQFPPHPVVHYPLKVF
jgi:hypothetical protein